MHCEDPACAEVCPSDAIKKTADGVVQTALPSHCIGCTNCVLACPFGVPHYLPQLDLMMKCDMCYDRTSAGKRPMCVTVCPSGALAYGTRAEIEALRRERPINTFVFGPQVVQTKVQMMVPVGVEALEVDITAFMTSTPTHIQQNGKERACPRSQPGRTISSRGLMTTCDPARITKSLVWARWRRRQWSWRCLVGSGALT
jgi:Fe-S-cluster-containing dehydrogenase component